MGCATGSQRLGNASSFSSAGVPHSGITREQKYGRYGVAENPFSRTEDVMACTHHAVLLARFSATGRNVCAQPGAHGVQCIRRSARRRRTERYASQRCVQPACHTSTASWLNWCQFWSRGCRSVANLCGCVSAGVNRGANVRRTTATGEEVKGTPDFIARLVAFKFFFANGDGMSKLPRLTGTESTLCRLQWNRKV